MPQASAPSEVVTILATMLSGSLIPSLMARLPGSETSSVDACGRGAGCANGAGLKAPNSVMPAGENTLLPTFCAVLKTLQVGKCALVLLSCASSCRVFVF